MDALPIIFSAIAAFAATLSAGLFVIKYRSNIGIMCAFAAGVLVAIAVFEIFPDVMALAPEAQMSLDTPLFAVAAGFFFLLAINRGSLRFQIRQKRDKQVQKSYRSTVGLFSTLEFCSHGFIEGLAIGIGFQFQLGLGLVIAMAVISHDFCDGLSTLTLMLSSGNTLKSSMNMLFVDAVAPVMGAAASLFFTVEGYMLVLALSFLAGSFVYMGAGSLLPEAHRKNRPLTTVVFFLAGLGLILLLSNLAGA